MPSDFELDRVERTVRSRAWGVVTGDDLSRHLERVQALFDQGILDATWGQVADFTAAASFDHISSEVIRPSAERNPRPKDSFRTLILPTDLGFGFGRMYEVFCGAAGENIHVVRSKADALAWMTHQRCQVQVNAAGG